MFIRLRKTFHVDLQTSFRGSIPPKQSNPPGDRTMKTSFKLTILLVSLATTMFYFFGIELTIWRSLAGMPPSVILLFLGFITAGQASYTYSLGDKLDKPVKVGSQCMPLPPPPAGWNPPKKELEARDERIRKLTAELTETKDELADFRVAKKLAPEPAAATQPAAEPSESLEFTI